MSKAASDIENFFNDNFSQYRPSVVHEGYRKTFAYRLSELVFGSLIASYILGFLSFASSVVREREISSISFYFDPLKATDLFDSIAYSKVYIFFVYLIISLMYSIFTALIYFNFHQSILYIQTSAKKAAYDYIMSLSVAVMFGISMLAPRYAFSLFLVLVAIVLYKKLRVSRTFIKSLAEHIYADMKDPFAIPRPALHKGINSEGQDLKNSALTKLRAQIELALLKQKKKTPETWASNHAYAWIAVVLIVSLLSLLVINLEFPKIGDTPPPNFIMRNMWLLYISSLLAVLSVLAFLLITATDNLSPSDRESYQASVDRQFLLVLKDLYKVYDQTKTAARLTKIETDQLSSDQAGNDPSESASGDGNDVG